jgi:hypothetical protein
MPTPLQLLSPEKTPGSIRDKNETGGWRQLIQNENVITIRYERQQEPNIPWHIRFTPSWQFTLTDHQNQQRRRQRLVHTTTTVCTDGPGSEVYMGKEIADQRRPDGLSAQPVHGTNEKREQVDGRNKLNLDDGNADGKDMAHQRWRPMWKRKRSRAAFEKRQDSAYSSTSSSTSSGSV